MTTKRTPDPSSAVDEFLASHEDKARGGAPCRTCELRNRAVIEKACRHFNDRRASGQTTVAWPSFVKHVLKKEFGYMLSYRALLNHLERHTDVEVS